MAGNEKPAPVDDDTITCPLCQELFVNPVLIKCYHTFCRKCLKQLKQKTGCIRCPLCQGVDKRDINSLPRNLYVEAKLLFRTSKDDRTCEICESKENVDWKCIECDQMMCNDCFKVHSKFKSSRDHKVIVYNHEDFKIKLTKVRHCEKHESEVLRFVCNTCEVPICRDCKMTGHESHQTTDLSDIVNNLRSWAKEKTDLIEEEIESLKHSIESFNSYKQLTDLQTSHLFKRVDDFEEKLHHQVSRECAELKERLAIDRQNILKHISDNTSKLMLVTERLSSKGQYIENVFSFGADADLIQCKNDIIVEPKKKLDKCKRMVIEVTSPRITSTKVSIQDMFKLEGYKHDGFFFNSRCKFLCEESLGKTTTAIAAGSEEIFIAFNNTNFSSNLLFRKTVSSHSKDGKLKHVLPIPPQFDIAVDEKGNMLWYSEEQCRIFWYPPSGDDKYKPVAEFVDRPIAVDISQEGNVVYLNTNKTMYTNFEKVFDASRILVSPMALCCVNNNIWVTDPGNRQVVIFSSNGRVLDFLREENIPIPVVGKFNPHGVCYNPNAKLVILSDSLNNFVLAIDVDRRYSFVLLTEEQGLYGPTCLATRENELWVCDRGIRINYYEI